MSDQIVTEAAIREVIAENTDLRRQLQDVNDCLLRANRENMRLKRELELLRANFPVGTVVVPQ